MPQSEELARQRLDRKNLRRREARREAQKEKDASQTLSESAEGLVNSVSMPNQTSGAGPSNIQAHPQGNIQVTSGLDFELSFREPNAGILATPITPPQILGSRTHISRFTHTPAGDRRPLQRVRPNTTPGSPSQVRNHASQQLFDNEDLDSDDGMHDIEPLLQQLGLGAHNVNSSHPDPSDPFHVAPVPQQLPLPSTMPPPPSQQHPPPIPVTIPTKHCSRGHHAQITAFTLDPNGVLRNRCEPCRAADANYRQRQRQQQQPGNPPPSNNDDLPAEQDEYDAFNEIGDFNLAAFVADAPALSERDAELVNNFRTSATNISMEHCTHCHEKWFSLQVTDNICKSCQSKGDLFTSLNNMDPGAMPGNVPNSVLTPMEEILIAPIHVMISIMSIRGGQTKYSGHICNFPRNNARLYQTLPLLPEDCDFFTLRRTSHDAVLDASVHQDTRVRRHVMHEWLQYFCAHHPAFADVIIDQQRLTQLPSDGSVLHRIPNFEPQADDNAPYAQQGPPEEGDSENARQHITQSLIPNLNGPQTELEQLKAAAHPNEPIIAMPSIADDPISEWNRIKIAVGAFPALFPTGLADFNEFRTSKVTFIQWAAHLLRYEDGRFAKHPRFRYWAMNTFLRDEAKKDAAWYITTHKDESAWTMDDLRDIVANGDENELKEVANRVARAGVNLPGSKPFWQKKFQDLLASVHQLHSPHLFFTASAADLQWPDLHLHMPSASDNQYASQVAAYRARRDDLNENPAIAADYFQMRWELFFKEVICKKFNVKDHWWRYEWQFRGSSHVHGFLWLNDAPQPENLDLDNEDSVQSFISFWDPIVSTWHPNITQPPAPMHPSAKPWTTLTDSQQELAELLNRFQRHLKCTSYCLRKSKPSGEERCRFRFPKDKRELSAIIKNERGFPELSTKRNDELLNIFCPVFVMGWRANVDIQPILSINAVLAYASKYVTKAESKSESYLDTLSSILAEPIDGLSSAKRAYQKLLSSLVAERDYSAQEVSHILLGRPLAISSRTAKSLNVSPTEGTILEFGEGSRERQSIRQKYQIRPQTLQNVSLLEFARKFDLTGKPDKWRRRPRAPEYVLKIYPRYSPNPDDDTYALYCFSKLLLHCPWVGDEDWLEDESLWISKWESFQNSHNNLLHDGLQVPNQEDQHPEESDDEEPPLDEGHRILPWMREAAIAPANQRAANMSHLGNRDVDQYDWVSNSGSPELVAAAETWLDEQKRSNPEAENELPFTDYRQLKGPQREIFLGVMAHIRHTVMMEAEDGIAPPPLQINIDGTAGTGKSFLIGAICTSLKELALELGIQNPVIRLAPTGVSAYGIRGYTINSGLCIPVKGWAPLSNSRLAHMQNRWAKYRIIILDEKSMVGRKMAGKIDRRTRELSPAHQHEILAGYSLLLFGDFAQLPPVGDSALFSTHNIQSDKSNLAVEGKVLYQSIKKSITLEHVFRQQGNDPAQVAFRTCLLQIREMNISDDSYELLKPRFWGNLTRAEKESFANEIHLLPTREAVHTFNSHRLASLNTPVLACKSVDTGPASSRASSDDAEGLEKTVLLSEGAHIMLTRNLWTSAGLVNGARGAVEKILFRPTSDPQYDLPAAVLVRFPGYTGPIDQQWQTFNTAKNNDPIVPITPFKTTWDKANSTCSRKQLPLTLSYAMTVHKSQGMTLERAVIDLGEKDFALGLSFVAISRVKTLAGIAFRSPFSVSRLRHNPGSKDTTRDALHKDNQRRSMLPYIHETYNVDLSMYNFLD